MAKKKNNFVSGRGNNPMPYNPEKVEKSVATYLAEEIDNQYRVFSGDIKQINEKIDKRYKDVLSHFVVLYSRIAKAEERIEILEKENQVLRGMKCKKKSKK